MPVTHLVIAQGDHLQHFWKLNEFDDGWRIGGTFGNKIVNRIDPVITRARGNSNLECIIVEGDERMHHYFMDENLQWKTNPETMIFGRNIKSRPVIFQNFDNKNFELIVRENDHLQHYWYSYGDGTNKWHKGYNFEERPITSSPAIFQNFDNKNLELLVGESDHLQHYYFSYSDDKKWHTGASIGENIKSDPAMFQNSDNKNYEVVVREGDILQHYWFLYGEDAHQIPHRWYKGNPVGQVH